MIADEVRKDNRSPPELKLREKLVDAYIDWSEKRPSGNSFSHGVSICRELDMIMLV